MPHDTVKLIECPRDAWQGLRRQIPTELKVRYLRALIDADFRHIDAVSFVSPKAVPQMADSEQVLEQLAPPAGVEIIGIVVNEKGAERAIASRAVTTLGYPCSISETFLRRNQNQTIEQNLAVLDAITRRADEANVGVVTYISMAFGNPYGDAWSETAVAELATKIGHIGISAVSLADTAGVAGAELIGRVVATVLRECEQTEIGVHLHSTRADAAEKILAAYDAGCRRFDAALGGLGGCPFAQDELVGNIPTEEVFRALQQRDVRLEMDDAIQGALTMSSTIGRDYSGVA